MEFQLGDIVTLNNKFPLQFGANRDGKVVEVFPNYWPLGDMSDRDGYLVKLDSNPARQFWSKREELDRVIVDGEPETPPPTRDTVSPVIYADLKRRLDIALKRNAAYQAKAYELQATIAKMTVEHKALKYIMDAAVVVIVNMEEEKLRQEELCAGPLDLTAKS